MNARLPVSLFIAATLGVSAISGSASVVSAERWLDDAGNRLPSVRILPETCRAAFAWRFIQKQPINDRTLLLLGDSQIFSASVDDDKTWGYHLATKRNLREVNLSIQDGRPGDTRYMAELVSSTGKRAGLAISNLNVSHFTPREVSLRHLQNGQTGFMQYLACAFRSRRLFVETSPGHPRDGDTHDRFVGGPLRPTYFDSMQDVVSEHVAQMLSAVQDTAWNTVAYVAPSRLESFGHYNFNIQSYDVATKDLYDACKRARTRVCVEDLSRSLDGQDFYDIVHFTERGHRRFSQLLNQSIGPPQ